MIRKGIGQKLNMSVSEVYENNDYIPRFIAAKGIRNLPNGKILSHHYYYTIINGYVLCFNGEVEFGNEKKLEALMHKVLRNLKIKDQLQPTQKVQKTSSDIKMKNISRSSIRDEESTLDKALHKGFLKAFGTLILGVIFILIKFVYDYFKKKR